MSPTSVGLTAMIIGAVGILIPLFILTCTTVCTLDIILVILIAGSIVFGCGTIAAAIGLRK